MTIADLLRDGRLELVPPDPDVARAILTEARRHLDSAAKVAVSDPNGAYALLYDGARKAVTAHMLANGYRVRPRSGAHLAAVGYAEEALAGGPTGVHVGHLDRMRRNRNRSEYDLRIFGEAEVAGDLEHARQVVTAVEAALEAVV